MASKVGAANTGEAFIGGAQTRNLAPPNVVGQGIPSANTSVGAPVGGVNPSQMKQARPNEGSNIGIPYSRLVPLNKGNALFAPKNGPQDKNQLRTETEDLRATCLAFVLGLRGSTGQKVQSVLGENGDRAMPIYNGQNVGFHTALMPGMVGTERFQQLCSLEYLQMYFAQVLSNKTIDLSQPDLANLIENDIDYSTKTAGPVGAYRAAYMYAASLGVNQDQQGNPELNNANTLLQVQDIAKKNGLANST